MSLFSWLLSIPLKYFLKKKKKVGTFTNFYFLCWHKILFQKENVLYLFDVSRNFRHVSLLRPAVSYEILILTSRILLHEVTEISLFTSIRKLLNSNLIVCICLKVINVMYHFIHHFTIKFCKKFILHS